MTTVTRPDVYTIPDIITPGETVELVDSIPVFEAPPYNPPSVYSVTIPFSTPVTFVSTDTDVINFGALGANTTVNGISGTPVDGQKLRIRFAQDAVGGRTISWGTGIQFGTDVTSVQVPTGASAKWEMLFSYHAASAKWRVLEMDRGF